MTFYVEMGKKKSNWNLSKKNKKKHKFLTAQFFYSISKNYSSYINKKNYLHKFSGGEIYIVIPYNPIKAHIQLKTPQVQKIQLVEVVFSFLSPSSILFFCDWCENFDNG